MGGLIGALATTSSADDDKAEFRRILQEEGFDVGREVRASFQARLAAIGVQVDESANHEFGLGIRVLGLAVPNGFYAGLRPVLVVDVIMTNPQGEVIFKQAGSVMNLSSHTERYTMKEYRAEPSLLIGELGKAINAVTDELIEKYQK